VDILVTIIKGKHESLDRHASGSLQMSHHLMKVEALVAIARKISHLLLELAWGYCKTVWIQFPRYLGHLMVH
jgi:hypothetical protein